MYLYEFVIPFNGEEIYSIVKLLSYSKTAASALMQKEKFRRNYRFLIFLKHVCNSTLSVLRNDYILRYADIQICLVCSMYVVQAITGKIIHSVAQCIMCAQGALFALYGVIHQILFFQHNTSSESNCNSNF